MLFADYSLNALPLAGGVNALSGNPSFATYQNTYYLVVFEAINYL